METFDSQLREIAGRHHLSAASASALVEGLLASQGTQVQFNIPEFGGMGQWMPGMVMAGSLFDSQLKAKVDAACTDIARLVREGRLQPASPNTAISAGGTWRGTQNWWPGDLGTPATTGGQNDMRYAWFRESRRLAIDEGGRISIYDTADHVITGVSQQQSGGGQTLAFTSQHGSVSLAKLRMFDDGASA